MLIRTIWKIFKENKVICLALEDKDLVLLKIDKSGTIEITKKNNEVDSFERMTSPK